jgi:hypothetical protein
MAAAVDYAVAIYGWADKSEEIIKSQIIRQKNGMFIT